MLGVWGVFGTGKNPGLLERNQYKIWTSGRQAGNVLKLAYQTEDDLLMPSC